MAIGAAIAGALVSAAANEALSDDPASPEEINRRRLIREQARVNRLDQFTPFGQLTFEGPERTTARLELDPQTQSIVDALQGRAQQRAANLPQRAFSPEVPDPIETQQLASRLPSVGGVEAGALGPFDQSTQAQQAVFQQAQQLLEPEFEQREERLRQTLANQGLPIGSEAFEDEFNRFDRQRNRAMTDAALRAVQAGNQRQSQLFQQGLSDVQARSGLQGQGFQQGLSALGAEQGIRQQNIGELGQLLGTARSAGPQPGEFFSPQPANVTGAAGLQQQGNLAAFNAAQQQRNAMLGGLFGLGGTAFSAAGQAGGFGNLFNFGGGGGGTSTGGGFQGVGAATPR